MFAIMVDEAGWYVLTFGFMALGAVLVIAPWVVAWQWFTARERKHRVLRRRVVVVEPTDDAAHRDRRRQSHAKMQ